MVLNEAERALRRRGKSEDIELAEALKRNRFIYGDIYREKEPPQPEPTPEDLFLSLIDSAARRAESFEALTTSDVLTPASQRALRLAQREANTDGVDEILSEHLLLGVLGLSIEEFPLSHKFLNLYAPLVTNYRDVVRTTLLLTGLQVDKDTDPKQADTIHPRTGNIIKIAYRLREDGKETITPDNLIGGIIVEGEGSGAQVLERMINKKGKTIMRGIDQAGRVRRGDEDFYGLRIDAYRKNVGIL